MTQYTRVEWHGPEVARQVEDAARRGLKLAGEYLLQVARTLVPLEEGTLERSGDPGERPGALHVDDLTAHVSFDTPYAVRQHEELDWRHAPGRQAKYLEEPAQTEEPVLQGLIAAQIRRASR